VTAPSCLPPPNRRCRACVDHYGSLLDSSRGRVPCWHKSRLVFSRGKSGERLCAPGPPWNGAAATPVRDYSQWHAPARDVHPICSPARTPGSFSPGFRFRFPFLNLGIFIGSTLGLRRMISSYDRALRAVRAAEVVARQKLARLRPLSDQGGASAAIVHQPPPPATLPGLPRCVNRCRPRDQASFTS
jgi:hypothetical protein